MLSDRQPRGSPEGLPEGRNEDASGAPERRLDGGGVRFLAGERSLAGKAKVAQELPSNPSGAVTCEKPGEKASTGTREYVAMLKTQIDDFDKRRFDSALRAKFITYCLTFLMIQR